MTAFSLFCFFCGFFRSSFLSRCSSFFCSSFLSRTFYAESSYMNFSAFRFLVTFSHRINCLWHKSKKLSLPAQLNQTFHKLERLCSKKQTDLLFKSGKGLLSYPVKAIFLTADVNVPFPAQAMFVAPKRQFKKAHDRNTLKRRMREAYRLNKQNLYEDLNAKNKKVFIAFIYVGKKEEEFALIQKSIKKLIALISAC